jgi:hypothetical protein
MRQAELINERSPAMDNRSGLAYRDALAKGTYMRERLISLMKRLKDEQQKLLFAAAESSTLPSLSTVQRGFARNPRP